MENSTTQSRQGDKGSRPFEDEGMGHSSSKKGLLRCLMRVEEICGELGEPSVNVQGSADILSVLCCGHEHCHLKDPSASDPQRGKVFPR